MEGLVDCCYTSMVRLNKHQLSPTQLKQLYSQFNRLLSEQKEAGVILEELLGPEERIMIAKRLSILILLLEGMSLYKISRLLKVSPTTAERVKLQLEEGVYDTIVGLLGKNKQSYFSILETLDAVLHLGGILPHYNGIERYRGI